MELVSSIISFLFEDPCKRLNLKVEAIADKNIVKIKVTQFHRISYIWTDKDKKVSSLH